MCDHGDTVPVRVYIPADLSHTGEARWDTKKIDRCLSDLVHVLSHGGVAMRSSCCGHGKGDGEIVLDDGRTLVVKATEPESDQTDVEEFERVWRKAQKAVAPLIARLKQAERWTPEMEAFRFGR